jgi:hypothetical protein
MSVILGRLRSGGYWFETSWWTGRGIHETPSQWKKAGMTGGKDGKKLA